MDLKAQGTPFGLFTHAGWLKIFAVGIMAPNAFVVLLALHDGSPVPAVNATVLLATPVVLRLVERWLPDG